MRSENYDIDKNLKSYVLQVESGGTGVNTKEKALEVLNAVDASVVNKPNGVLGLNEDGFIGIEQFPADFGGAAAVNIFGPKEVQINNSIILEITNFDSFTNYDLKAYKVEVQQENELLLVTGKRFGNDAWISVNGSVYPINVLVDNASLQGDLINFRDLQEQRLENLAANSTGSLIAIGKPKKDVEGSSKAGEVSLFSFTENSGYQPLEVFNQGDLVTRITYTGAGTKTFTANNQVFTREDEGYIDLIGAGNVILSATGKTVVTPATAQVGLAAYPNGLPPYVAGQGMANYPNGLPSYIAPSGAVYVTKTRQVWVPPVAGSYRYDYVFKFLDTSLSKTETFASEAEARAFYNNRLASNTNGWLGSVFTINQLSSYPAGKTSSYTQAQLAVLYEGGYTSAHFLYPPAQTSGVWGVKIDINWFGVNRTTLVAPADGYYRTETYQEFSHYTNPGQGSASYPNGLPRYRATVGNAAYPGGLPIYKPAQAASSYTDTVIFRSDTFTISGKSINQTVFPWENFGYGESIDVQDQVIAVGCTRDISLAYPTGGEVLVRRKNGNVWTPYRVTIPKTSPFPFFGKSVKLWANGNRLMVGAPGHNKVHQFNFGSNIYNEGRVYSVPNIADGANFGISIDIAPNDSVMAIGAPGALGTGAIYIYSLNGNSFDESGVINITGLQNGESIGHKVRIVNNNRVFSIVRNANNTNSYVAEFIYSESGTWEMRKAFFNPTPNSDDGYAEDFDIPDTFDMMYISAKGNTTTKGQVHIWLQAGGEWLYYKSVMDPNGTFGNGFGKALAINANGKAGHILSSNLNEGKLGYYK